MVMSRGGETRTPDQRIWRPLLYQLSYTPMCTGQQAARLLGFLIQDVFPHYRVILPQFNTCGGSAAIFGRVIHVTTFAALEFDQNAIAFFRHRCLSAVYLKVL